MNVWIDIDNEPQARYLLPLARAFERRGHDVLLTARDQGETLGILDAEGASFEAVGSSFGRGTPRKLRGLVVRAGELRDFLKREGREIDVLVTGSRSATLIARLRQIPSFVIIDYEHVNLLVYRLSGVHILHPDLIEPSAFQSRGIRRDHLFPFNGLKEDLTFSALDVEATPPLDLGANGAQATVLFRPPAEESHYYRSESRDLALAVLHHLARQDVRLVLSPRDSSQISYLDEVQHWRCPPIVLTQVAPLVALLKAVDAVVSAGGTMLREAAYLGVPAYSVFRSRIGAVDRHLASIGRLSILTRPADFSRIRLSEKGTITPLRRSSSTADQIVKTIEHRMTVSSPVGGGAEGGQSSSS